MQLGGILVVQHTHRQKNVRWLFSLRFQGRISPGMREVSWHSLCCGPQSPHHVSTQLGQAAGRLGRLLRPEVGRRQQPIRAAVPHRSPCERDRVFRCVVPATPNALRPLATFERALAPPSCVSHTSLTSVTANSSTAVHIVGQLVGASGFDFPKVYARWRVIAGAAHVPSDESGGSSDGT